MNLFNQLEKYVSRTWDNGSLLISIMRLETQLAGLSLLPLLLGLVSLLVGSITLWIAVMVLAGYFFTWIFGNLLIGILCVVFLNALICSLLVYSVISNIKMMSFQKTRKLLKTGNQRD